MTKPAIGTVGTLKELQVECGDVVECLLWEDGNAYEGTNPHYIRDGKHGVAAYEDNDDSAMRFSLRSESIFRLISRANSEPKMWKDMTPEEKGALLLAAHEGKAIEVYCWDHDGAWWNNKPTLVWSPDRAYRIKPEPVRETVTLYGAGKKWRHVPVAGQKHLITFDTIDGKPDVNSVKMEEI